METRASPSRTASEIARPPSAVGRYRRSATGPRQSVPSRSVDPGHPVADAHEAPDVAGVAVGVPARRGDDRQRPPEVAVAVQQRHRHQGVVGHDMNVAAVAVVPIALLDPSPRRAPVGLAGTPVADVIDEPPDDRVARDLRHADVEQWSRSSSTKAWASIAARTCAAWTAAPSWLTCAARRARSAAASGSPGWTIAQPSMKIWAPICSATTWLLSAIEPLARGRDARLQSQIGGVLGRVARGRPTTGSVRPSMR